ncbi:conserved exported hypothetical protein [Pseudomonas sp. 8AS]|uniref:chalcone isomerase family protein n=1 Tax=Pseudomonas sp. 8AS TaxID=2653163 RepID=UPI0012F2192B|nr:chalcone isomerase family protein [Pseudomonas sp. 8AS]VXC01687.1 conserved exported hypothetical protein [Pseudomonas sp. 8AS]
MHRMLLILLLLTSSQLQANSERLDEAAFSERYQQAGISLVRKNQALLTYLWADVYAAAFYAEATITPSQAASQPARQRLELYYYRDIAKEDVIKAAWVTLERQHSSAQLAKLKNELDALHATFRDIQPGDRYALNYSPDAGLTLERNGNEVFRSSNTELARTYLGIWLAPEGLSDSLREQLLTER